MNNRDRMIKTCRAALSVLAGVDDRTRSEVAEMSMRHMSAGSQQKEEVVDLLLAERTMASDDFRF